MAHAPLVIEVLAPGVVGVGLARAFGLDGSSRRRRPGDPGGEDAYVLWRLLDHLRERHGQRIAVHLIEPLSFAWILRVLRYRPRRYPAFVVGGRALISGLDEDILARTVAEHLRDASAG